MGIPPTALRPSAPPFIPAKRWKSATDVQIFLPEPGNDVGEMITFAANFVVVDKILPS